MRGAAAKRAYIRHHRPRGMSVAEGCRLMGIVRSTYYDEPTPPVDDTGIVAAMAAICGAFEAYGYRGVGAAFRHQGIVVNSEKIRRLDARARSPAEDPAALCRDNAERS